MRKTIITQIFFVLLLSMNCVAISQQMISIETEDGFTYYPLEDVSITFNDYLTSDSIAIALESETQFYALSDIDSISFQINDSGFEERISPISLPGDFILEPAFPNPFNPETTISVILRTSENLLIDVYNLNGQRVAKLANGKFEPGKHQFTFNAEVLSSGIYFINTSTDHHSTYTQKVIFMK